jgi:hypothetical protein
VGSCVISSAHGERRFWFFRLVVVLTALAARFSRTLGLAFGRSFDLLIRFFAVFLRLSTIS